MIEAGRDELTKEFRREGVPLQRAWKSDAIVLEVEAAGYGDLDSLLAAIGEHHVSAHGFAQKVARGTTPATRTRCRRASSTCVRVDGSGSPGVHVEGLDDVLSVCRSAARRCPATRSSGSSRAAVASRCTVPTAPTPRA
jgi:guanosine-3',5'-bis(diphosphate) 3'-pyrophosphohydrolase